MKIAIVYGTRPELIKLAPLIKLIEKQGVHDLKVISTGQHKEMLEPLQDLFEIQNTENWSIMVKDQSLNHICSQVISKMDSFLEREAIDLVVVQGDTSTVLAASIAAYYRRVKVAHVEAGLRSFDLDHPFPEEFNRRIVSTFAEYNFAPTENAMKNLLDEGISSSKIEVTGNTVIDALHILKDQLKPANSSARKILITAHRRENHGVGIRNICHAVKEISKLHPEVEFIWPVHPNPNVNEVVFAELEGTDSVKLMPPVDYLEILQLMKDSYIIWTDSGGIQEEAPSFLKPVLILRNVTERPEVVDSGFGKLIGVDRKMIVSETTRLLNDSAYYESFIGGENPFGDGTASQQILNKISS